MKKWLYIVFLTLFLLGCKKSENTEIDRPYTLNYPPGFPPVESPENNQLTEKRVELGRLLFLDKRLSKDSSVACVTCHLPEKGLTDGLPLSFGINGRSTIRNAPTLFNVGYHPYFFKDGGVPTLEAQAIAPIEDHNEMGFSVPGVVERLKDDQTYTELAEIAYDRTFDPFVLTRALAAFQRTLISGNSPYDQFINGDSSALTASEKRGLALFNGNRTNCSGCHTGIDFTDYGFRNNGLYYSYPDTGRERITLNPDDKGKFKTPSLRNIALTAPYMFDGSLSTLEEVIKHYASGGAGHPNQDGLIKQFRLSEQEKNDLVNFLNSLTDQEAINDVKQKLR